MAESKLINIIARITLFLSIGIGIVLIYQLIRHLLGGSWDDSELLVAIIMLTTGGFITMAITVAKLQVKQNYEFKILRNELNHFYKSLYAQINRLDNRLSRVEHTLYKEKSMLYYHF